jgi:hypothetical protein
LVAAAITLLLIAAHAARLGVFAVLAALEPIIRILLSLLAMGGLAACVLYRFVVHAPHFPFGLMLMLSAGFSVLLVLYYLAMRALSLRREDDVDRAGLAIRQEGIWLRFVVKLELPSTVPAPYS